MAITKSLFAGALAPAEWYAYPIVSTAPTAACWTSRSFGPTQEYGDVYSLIRVDGACSCFGIFGLPFLPIDKIIAYVVGTAVAFFTTLYLLIYYSILNRDRFSRQKWVKKRLQPVNTKISRMDTEIRSLLSASFLDAIPLDARLIDKQLLAEAHEMVVAEPEISWVEIERRLDTQLMLQRTRRQSLFASEWFRLFGASFPEKRA